jgi:hypothetical protein
MLRTQATIEGKTNSRIDTETKKVVGMTQEMEHRINEDMEKSRKKLSKQNKLLQQQLEILNQKLSSMTL